jgi:DNA-binding CsgD family transcriptional regulator/tetratricopeptide (TPR) repeat protein
LLRASAELIADADPTEAARLLLECLAPLVREARLAEIVHLVGTLQSLRERIDTEVGLRVDAVAAVFAMIGAPPSAGGLEFVQQLLRDEGVTSAAAFVAEVIAPALAYTRRDAALGEILDQVERALRDEGAIVPLISVLAAQQLRHFGARQPLAIDAGEEAIRLATEIDRPKLAMMAACGLAVAASAAGDAVAYEFAADLLATSEHEHARAARLMGLGTLHMTTGRFEQALAVWEEMAATHGVGDPLLTADSEHVETLAKMGRLEEAQSLIERLDNASMTEQSRARVHRIRGILAEDDVAAAGHFSRAIELFASAGNRIAEGRAELCWGERLRRGRRRADARLHLHRALELFRAVGVPTYAARAEAELAATGAVVDSTLPVHALLTARELRVARLVAAGSSNREIGVELFVSERTVESHLTAIFRKLQVKNRRELTARANVDPVLRTD